MDISDSQQLILETEHLVQPDDPCCIQFSSGTTGQPKATLLSHFGTINNSHFFGKRCGYDKMHHTLCLQVPMFHIMASALGILCGLDFGMTLVLPGPTFNKDHTIEALEKLKCNVLYGTPTMYVDLCSSLKKLKSNSPNLQKVFRDFQLNICGGSYCSPSLLHEIQETFSGRIQVAYGLTETSPICFTHRMEDSFQQRLSTVGFVTDHLEVKIVNSNGRMVKFGEPGEAWFRSYGNLLEYWGNPEKTNEAITSSNWFKSGDLMVLTEDGYGTVVGRIKDIIIRGGENIFPSEIEKFLIQHPEIEDAQVFGVKDTRMGEEVAVCIKLAKSSTMTEVALKEYCKGKISHFKIPKYVKFVNEYPTTLSGKVKKFVLKKTIEQELGY